MPAPETLSDGRAQPVVPEMHLEDGAVLDRPVRLVRQEAVDVPEGASVRDDEDAAAEVGACDPFHGCDDARRVLLVRLAVRPLSVREALADLVPGEPGPRADVDLSQVAVDDD